jgi:MFS superfamily sulfate permease-like transporter
VPAGLRGLFLPHTPFDTLIVEASSIALIAFCSAMPTARSFAAKNGYDIDNDCELAAIGAANIASALSQETPAERFQQTIASTG